MVRVWKDLTDDDNAADVFGDGYNRSTRGQDSDSESMTVASTHTMDDEHTEMTEAPHVTKRHRSVSSPLSPALPTTLEPSKSASILQETASALISQPPPRKVASRPSTTPEVSTQQTEATTTTKPLRIVTRSNTPSPLRLETAPVKPTALPPDRVLRTSILTAILLTIINILWLALRSFSTPTSSPVLVTDQGSSTTHPDPFDPQWRIAQLESMVENQTKLTLRFVSDDLHDLSPLSTATSHWWKRENKRLQDPIESMDELQANVDKIWRPLRASQEDALKPLPVVKVKAKIKVKAARKKEESAI